MTSAAIGAETPEMEGRGDARKQENEIRIRQTRSQEGRSSRGQSHDHGAAEEIGHPVVGSEQRPDDERSTNQRVQARAFASVTPYSIDGVLGADKLALWADAIADWADRMPLSSVFVFGAHVRGGGGAGDKLKIAVEYDCNVSDEIMRSWQQENASGFASLEEALGVQIELFAEPDRLMWPAIRDAARAPLLTVRKVKVVRAVGF